MKTALGCLAQTFLLLAVAAPLACGATLTAPLHSPQIAEKFVCPPNMRLVTEWYQATWNRPGEQTLRAYCLDADGQQLPTLPQDEKMLLAGIPIYFP